MLAICLGLSALTSVWLRYATIIFILIYSHLYQLFVNLKSSRTIVLYDDVVLTFLTETSTTAVNMEHSCR